MDTKQGFDQLQLNHILYISKENNVLIGIILSIKNIYFHNFTTFTLKITDWIHSAPYCLMLIMNEMLQILSCHCKGGTE